MSFFKSFMTIFGLLIWLLATFYLVTGCDQKGTAETPFLSPIPYHETYLSKYGYSKLIEIQYEGKRHVFFRSGTSSDVAICKIGEYPINPKTEIAR